MITERLNQLLDLYFDEGLDSNTKIEIRAVSTGLAAGSKSFLGTRQDQQPT